jgi:hypothetical protein
MKGLSTNMYQTVQVDTTGRKSQYSIFQGNIFGTPSLPKRNGSISFGLINIVEAKIFQKNDTTGKPKKVKLIDNFSINTSYSIFADSLRWAPLVMSYRTVLFENINIAANSNFSFYGLDSKGYTHNVFYMEQAHKPLRLTGFSTSLDFDVGKLIRGKGGKTTQKQPVNTQQQRPDDDMYGINKTGSSQSNTQGQQAATNLPLDKYGYADFDRPWNLRVDRKSVV